MKPTHFPLLMARDRCVPFFSKRLNERKVIEVPPVGDLLSLAVNDNGRLRVISPFSSLSLMCLIVRAGLSL